MRLRSILGIVLSMAILTMFGCGGGGNGGGGAQAPTITATAGTGGTISPSGAVAVTTGSNQTFTITPNAGFFVSDVQVDGVSQGAVTSFTFTNVIVSHTISATFAANPTITATAGTGGAISPSGNVLVTLGSDQTFTITPNAGFSVADVLVDGVSQGSVTTFTFTNVIANHTLTVSFVANPTSAVVTVVTEGVLPADTVIGAIQATINYTTPGLTITDANVVVSGPAAAVPNTFVIPNTTTDGQLGIGLISGTGISTGQFATATFSITSGSFPTAADFNIAAGATVFDLNGFPIPGISVVIGTVLIQ